MDPASLRRILFVCIENANRSQMAAAFARRDGAGVVEAHSAGSRPAPQVNPRTVEAMREVGIDISEERPQSLAEAPDVEYDVVVGMGCGDEECPLVRARRREEWGIPDPRAMTPEQFREVRDLIGRRVQELLAALAAGG